MLRTTRRVKVAEVHQRASLARLAVMTAMPVGRPPSPAAGETPASKALQTLVRTRLDEMRLSYAQAADRGGLPKSTVHFLATAPALSRMPNDSTLVALAAAIDVPLSTVRRAAARSVGLTLGDEHAADPTADDISLDVLVSGVRRLSPEDRAHVLALVRSMLPDD